MSQHHFQQTECESSKGYKEEYLDVEQIYSVQSSFGCLLLCQPAAELLDSGGSGKLKYKMKVLLRSQRNCIPPLLVYSRLAYGDTEDRSISIADGAARGRKSVELTLICIINQLIVTGELTWVAANVSQCDNIKSVC